MKSCFYCVTAVIEDITRIAARLVACLMYLFTDMSIIWVGFETMRYRVPYKVKLTESPFGIRMQPLPFIWFPIILNDHRGKGNTREKQIVHEIYGYPT